MVEITSVMDAINLRLVELWPTRTVYVDVCPQDFVRPSSWLQGVQDDFDLVGRGLYQRTMTVSITLFDQLDAHYEVSWSRLARDAAQVQRALLQPLKVDGRHLLPVVKTRPRESDNALLLAQFDFLDNLDCPQPPSPPETGGTLHVAVRLDGKTVAHMEDEFGKDDTNGTPRSDL